VLRRGEHDVARDPSGWARVILSPVLPGVEFELMRTTIPAGVDAGAFSPHAAGSREYLAIERGTLTLTLDGTPVTLRAGDSVYYAGDCRHAFANPGQEPCVYYLAMGLGRHPAPDPVATPVAARTRRAPSRSRQPARARPHPR
jgi:XRE family transcriptional regulator, regulator of sulfur utilization